MATEYKNKVLFARISKSGEKVNIYNHDGILQEVYKMLLINTSDMQKLLSGEYESIKVSAMKEEDFNMEEE